MEDKKQRLVLSAAYVPIQQFGLPNFPWTTEVDNLEIEDDKKYKEVVKLSRFFYKHDPIASTVINKLIDIAVTQIIFYKNGLSENEFKVFQGLKNSLYTFMEDCALEYLLTGMVIPEITYGTVEKDTLRSFGTRKLETFTLPIDMWVRDSGSIVVNRVYSSKSSYYVEVPSDMVTFIQTKGTYPDGTKDVVAYEELLRDYPDFVTAVRNGERYIKLDNPYVIERKKMSNEKYPIPYLYSALESLKHKRNLRKMDYSIASRVITAIQLIKMGDKDFPLTEDNQDQLDDLKEQMLWRDGTYKNVEKIFQLFGNHTISIEWIFPPVEALLNDAKYRDVNQDILFALGFPRILITGEAERTGTTVPEYAVLSPIKTMDSLRIKLLDLLNKIVEDICVANQLTKKPEVDFVPMNLFDFYKYFEMLSKLYDSGNLSRDSYADALGFNLETELQKRKEETGLIKEYGLQEFSPLPHSNAPGGAEKPKPKEKPQPKDDSTDESGE